MASVARCFLIGNLTRDPETRTTPRGTAICQFGLAVNRKYKDEAGQVHDEATFLDIEAWGKVADLAGKYLTKGAQVCIEGRLKQDNWEDKTTGAKRSKIKVVADQLHFLSSPRSAPAGEPQPAQVPQSPAAQAPGAVDEDVPF